MHSPFAQAWAADALPALYAQFGGDASIARGAGAPVPIRLRPDRDGAEGQDVIDLAGSSVVAGSARVRALASAVAASPLGTLRRGDLVTLSGAVWRIQGDPLVVRPHGLEITITLAPAGGRLPDGAVP